MAKPSTNFDPRRLMEQAVDVMRQSRAEPRKDGKATPKVGAVLWHPDGTIQTAHRGELREGDHAEFTILERKNRDRGLDGCKLFATLEPCAPGSRAPHKTPCAERIVLARIKEVWVGIEDPDPLVADKGIRYLEDSGVTVHIFPRDLQKQIQAENQKFLAQAEARARVAEDEPAKPVAISALEQPLKHLSNKWFSPQALHQFREAAEITPRVGSREFGAELVQRGLAAPQRGRLVPTGFGLLLFGKVPRATMPQAGLLATITHANGKQETKDFEGPLVLIPQQVEDWLRNKLPQTIDRGSMRRRESPDVPFEVIREAIVNALIHRDYDIQGAKCQLLVTPDTITIKSPGRPVSPITLEQLQAFEAPMRSRNPYLHYVFSKLGYAEERGLGLASIGSRARESGLPVPKYRWKDPYLELTLFRTAKSASTQLSPALLAKMTKAEIDGWNWLSTKSRAKSIEYAKAQRVDDRTARRHLNRFVDLGLASKSGAARSTMFAVR